MRRFLLLPIVLILAAGCSEYSNPTALDDAIGFGAAAGGPQFELYVMQLGDGPSSARAISDAGHVAGNLYDGYSQKPFIWTEAGGPRIVEVGSGFWSVEVMDVNTSGMLALVMNSDSYVWSADGGLLQIPSNTPYTYVRALGNNGTAVGDADWSVAWTWSQEAGFQTLPGGYRPVAIDINDTGLIAGNLGTTSVFWHPDLSVEPIGYGYTKAMNNLGDTVGQTANRHAFVRLQGGTEIDITPTAAYAEATAISDSRIVVGRMRASNNWDVPNMPFYWTQETGTQLLPMTAEFDGGAAWDINNDNTIVGWLDPVAGGGWRTAIWKMPAGPTTPEEALVEVVTMLEELIQTTSLSANNAGALITKVESAAKKLAKNNPEGALGSLNAAINQIHAFMNAGKLSMTLGNDLIAAIQVAIDMITI
ncbi:hypothetical protein ACFL6T_03080 [Candidatus Zixiibacteriota bacterium]